MEVVQQRWVHEEAEEVAEEVGLQGRQHRQHSQTSTTVVATATPAPTEVESSGDEKVLENEVFFSNGTGTTEPTEEFFYAKIANLHIKIADSNTSPPAAVSSLTPSNKSTNEQVAVASSSNKGTTDKGSASNLIEESINGEELYLDKVYKKAVPHEFYCPNCKSCIQKVIVCDLESDSAQLPDQNDDTFRCTTCFSFLIPAGNWFVRNFVPNEQGRRNKQQAEPNFDQDPSRSYSSLGKIHDQTKPQPSETALPDKTSHLPPSNVAPALIAGAGMNSGGIQIQDSEKDNVHDPGSDSAIQEAELGRGVKVNTDYKLSQKTETDKGLITLSKGAEPGDPSKSSTTISIPEIVEDGQIIHSEPRDEKKWEIIKSIVYGGLTESVTSLGVVTSAASADATTLNILALSLANLVGGLFIIGHNLRELKNEQPEGTSNQTNERVDRYQELLGKKQNFILHAIVAILSFLVFGLVPPVVYGFSFRESDNKDYKLAAVAAASLLCIIALAIFKAYVRKPPKGYIKTLLHYAVIGIATSGVSYIAGELIKKLIEKLGLFNPEVSVTVALAEISSGRHAAWASY